VLDRQGVEAATGAASLGMLADDVLIAVVRFQKGLPLSDRDRGALDRAAKVIGGIRELGTRQIVLRSTLRDMAPVGVLDETFQAIAAAREGQAENLAAGLESVQQAIEEILAGTAEEAASRRLREFFDRLGAITLARSEDIARPGREQREKWIKEALGSL